jgi:hypothetical protein
MVFSGHEMMLDDGSTFGITEEIFNVIVVVQQFVKQVNVQEVVGCDKDAVCYQTWIVLELLEALTVPATWRGSRSVSLVRRRQGSWTQ